ncbi:MAG: hypothetical protein MJ211_06440 [Bacteroidales bacterium]|nr:hypothetical protein [Bacteroidales bacterium]
MKKRILNILLLSIFSTIMFSCNMINGGSQYEIDSLQTLLDEYILRDSIKSAMIENYDNSISKFGNIQDSIKARELAIDSLRSVIKYKGYTTKDQSAQLNKLINQIRSFISQNQEIATKFQNSGYKSASAQQLVNMMLNTIEAKQKELVQLQEQVNQLSQKVSNLQEQNAELTNTISQKNEELTQIQNDASKLTLSNVKVTLPDVKKAKKINSIQFDYSINENKYAKEKSVTIYIRVYDENGNVLNNSESGLFNYQGNSIAYTTKSKVSYNGQKVSETVIWNTDGVILTPGKYLVSFFVNGAEIDQTYFILKK